MALINLIPFDLTRRPGRPTRTDRNKGTLATTATERVQNTPEKRPVVNKALSSDRRRRLERRHNYKPIQTDKRKNERRSKDFVSATVPLPEEQLQKTSIDFKV